MSLVGTPSLYPLWQVVLNKICNGDRDRALKLINDPDQLTQYPEVEAILAAGGCVHSLSSATVGAIAGLLYAGRLLEPVALMLLCSVGALLGSALIHRFRHHTA